MDYELIEFQYFIEDFFNLKPELEIDEKFENAEEVILEEVDESEVIDGTTDTTTIDRIWPDGWQPTVPRSVEDAALMAAAVGESSGLHRGQTVGGGGDESSPSPFETINRRFP